MMKVRQLKKFSKSRLESMRDRYSTILRGMSDTPGAERGRRWEGKRKYAWRMLQRVKQALVL